MKACGKRAFIAAGEAKRWCTKNGCADRGTASLAGRRGWSEELRAAPGRRGLMCTQSFVYSKPDKANGRTRRDSGRTGKTRTFLEAGNINVRRR